jgi:Spy/CpxP family protein refolding chaperone
MPTRNSQTDDLKGLTVTKTLRIALLVASVPTAAFLGTPAALFAQTGASGPGKDTPAQTSREAITDQEIKLLQQDVRDQRRQIVAANLPLTTDESATFWPVYDEYISEVTKILDSRYAQIKEYVGHYATMDDKQATDYIGKLFDADRALMDLRVKYQPAFEKVLPKKKSAMFLQMDRRLQMMIDLQRAGLIPLINPK